MGRKRKYHSNAARQQAYRDRIAYQREKERRYLEQLKLQNQSVRDQP